MSYSCSDFTDSIIDALGVEIPDESNDSPSDQADICLAEIERLQKLERSLVGLLADILDHCDGDERDLDVVANDLIRYFDLQKSVDVHRS